MENTDADRRLEELKNQINVQLQKADDHLITAAKELAEARRLCDISGQSFKRWCLQNIKKSYHYLDALAVAGAAANVPKAIEDMRAATKARVRAHRQRLKARVPLRNGTAQADAADYNQPGPLPDGWWAFCEALEGLPQLDRIELILAAMDTLGVTVAELEEHDMTQEAQFVKYLEDATKQAQAET